MGFIGKQPTKAPLTSSDIPNDIINSDHLGDTAISGFSALAESPADTDEFLISDGGTLKRIDASHVGGGLDNWSENSGNLLPSNASYGVYLGVNSATASNLLDDYEEGTADVNIRVEGRGDSSTAGTRSSSYTKIGNRVFVRFYMNMTSATGTSSGRQLQIFNLPFNLANLYSTTAYASLGGLESNADKFFQVMLDNNSNTGQIQQWDGIQGDNFSDHFDTSTIYLEMSYQTA